MERTSIPHVRISSVEPMDISERLLRVMARFPQRIAPFLHLPVQSGCTATLHRMGRPYSAEAFEDTVRMIRANLPQASLSCDVIVGFPGETDEEFEESLALCRRVGFSRMHVFRYSKRPGTLLPTCPTRFRPRLWPSAAAVCGPLHRSSLLPTLAVAWARSSVPCSSMATT